MSAFSPIFNYQFLAIPAILAISPVCPSCRLWFKGFWFSDHPITRDVPITRFFRPHPAFSPLLLQTKALAPINAWASLA
jgi:hypothetical protein